MLSQEGRMRVLVMCLITAAAEIILAVREGTIVSAVCLRSMMWVVAASVLEFGAEGHRLPS